MPFTGVFFIETLGALYKDVQEKKIFPDSKYFVDCVPNGDPVAILARYEKEKNSNGFDLIKFVTQHFIFPVELLSMYHSGNKTIHQHLEELWQVLTPKQP